VKAGFAFVLFSRRSKDYGLAGQQMKNFFYVYMLVNQANKAIHYTGITRDLEQRLLEHNQGACPHTSKHRPWKIETTIAFKSESKARAFEKYLKSGSGREFARRHFWLSLWNAAEKSSLPPPSGGRDGPSQLATEPAASYGLAGHLES
jgi:putative endonuclease